MRLSTVFLWAMVAALLSAVGVLLFDVATQWSVVVLQGIWPLLFYVAGHMMPAAACAWVRERGRLRGLMLSGIIASLVSLVLVLLAAFDLLYPFPYELLPMFGSTAIWAASMMFIGLLSVHPFPPGPGQVVRVVSIFIVAVLTAQSLVWVWLAIALEPVMSWQASEDFHEGMAQIAGVLGVLGGCGASATYIMARSRKLSGAAGTIPRERRVFSITCPRCGAPGTLNTGGDACAGCGLRITVNAV
jgi:hypothetical protein